MRGQVAAVTVENAETLGENEYLIPPKIHKEWVNILKFIGATGSGYFSRMAIRDSVPLTEREVVAKQHKSSP